LSKHQIKYANCWEDAYLLDKALQVDENSSVFSIASGGDNSLFLLKNSPKTMLCVDYNPEQLYLTQLKAAAIKEFDFNTCLKFLGFEHSEERIQNLQSLKSLSQKAMDYWNSNSQLITRGVIHQGKFERYLNIFSQRLLPLARSKKMVVELLKPKSQAEQQAFYKKNWHSWQWRTLFRGFFNQTTMSRLGRDPEKFKEVSGEVEQVLWQRTEDHFTSKECQNNYLLSYILTGNFSPLPPYLQEFDACKKWLNNHEVTYFLGSMKDALISFPTCNRFNLSNVFEYMDEATFNNHVKELYTHSLNDSKFGFWNLLVPRIMDSVNGFHPIDTGDEVDFGFFYDRFYCVSKTEEL